MESDEEEDKCKCKVCGIFINRKDFLLHTIQCKRRRMPSKIRLKTNRISQNRLESTTLNNRDLIHDNSQKIFKTNRGNKNNTNNISQERERPMRVHTPFVRKRNPFNKNNENRNILPLIKN